jgi:NAD(P)-dependent dehydrogenase (short-subunit alcohol dehydrogenase family)
MKLKNKVAIVTESASGTGRPIDTLLVQEGAKGTVTDRRV